MSVEFFLGLATGVATGCFIGASSVLETRYQKEEKMSVKQAIKAAMNQQGVFAVTVSEKHYNKAMTCVRGSYQEDILDGIESVSGSTLQGLARKHGATYAESRNALFSRMKERGVLFCVVVGRNNRNVLVIGKSGKQCRSWGLPVR